MKNKFNFLLILFQCFILITTLCSVAQQQITHIVTRENKSGNGDGTELDITAVKDDPKAILFVTPLNDKEWSNNPHPVMAFYFKGKWNIMNLDNAAMPIGVKFNVSYFIKPDPEHFQYLVTKEMLQKDGSALVDHPSLNNNPGAQFTIFHSWVPEFKEYANREQIKTQYNSQEGKWVVSNISNKSLIINIAYNINISPGSKPATVPVSNTPGNSNTTNPAPVTTNTTNTVAGNSIAGPIVGMYMTVWAGPTKLPGESNKIAHLDQVELVDFELGVASPRDLATGQSSGKKQYEPIVIKKFSGGLATIPYFNALVKNQDLIITIDFYSVTNNSSGGGAEGLNYTMKLTGARLSSFHQVYEETTSTNHAKGYLDVVKIIFAKIEFIKDGVSVTDF